MGVFGKNEVQRCGFNNPLLFRYVKGMLNKTEFVYI
jgi:hypothetical protein